MLILKKIITVLCLIFLLSAESVGGKALKSPLMRDPSELTPTIYIYNGPGTSALAVKQVEYSLQTILKQNYFIKLIGPEEVKQGKWHNDAVLFIMPGGADLPYCQHLSPQGNKQIKQFVKAGGSYLGFCAGAYYGCQSIEFAIGTPLEVVGLRELAFFPGIAKGPVLAAYNYKTNSGARLALLRWHGLDTPISSHSRIYSYFNGGCYFVKAAQLPNVTVLATYIIKGCSDQEAAIVEIKVDKGLVILSGVHCEYAPELLDKNDQYLLPIRSKLLDNDSQRLKVFTHLLQRLRIKTVA